MSRIKWADVPKPRIVPYRRADRPGKWRCYSHVSGLEFYQGTGYTPLDAYLKWIAALTRRPAPTKPCRSPYCECDAGRCCQLGWYDARHEAARLDRLRFPTPVAPCPGGSHATPARSEK